MENTPLRIAFASDDLATVNLHFGASEQFVLYDVIPGEAKLVGVGQFVKARMKGVNAERHPDDPPPPPDEEVMTEDTVTAKLEFLADCACVYAAKIGTSSIKRLMIADIQPIIVNKGFPIVELLNEVSLAMACGGLSWVDRNLAKPKQKTWNFGNQALPPTRHELITSIDDEV